MNFTLEHHDVKVLLHFSNLHRKSIAYRILNDDDFSDFKKEIGSEANIDMKVGSKVILKDNLGFDNQLDRNKYNNMEVTIEDIYYDSETGEVDVFFIEEDNGYYEWVVNQIKN